MAVRTRSGRDRDGCRSGSHARGRCRSTTTPWLPRRTAWASSSRWRSRAVPAACSSVWADRRPPTEVSARCAPCSHPLATERSRSSWRPTCAPSSSTRPRCSRRRRAPARRRSSCCGADSSGSSAPISTTTGSTCVTSKDRVPPAGWRAVSRPSGPSWQSGFEVVADEVKLYERIEAADLVVTGEGFLDAESFDGKVVGGVCDLAREAGVPAIAVVGQAFDDVDQRVETISLVERFGRTTRRWKTRWPASKRPSRNDWKKASAATGDRSQHGDDCHDDEDQEEQPLRSRTRSSPPSRRGRRHRRSRGR